MLRHSNMLDLGTPAPDFALADTAGKVWTPADFADKPALLAAFICNECPFVLHVLDGLVAFARDYQPRGVGVVAISANDIESHPGDAPAEMDRLARERGFTFPYLFDETQAVAIAFEAICTPDFFLFGPDRRLAYRGQMDASRPRNGVPVTGSDLRAAADAVLSGAPAPAEQAPSIGCNIKWKAGLEPEWA